MKSLSILIQFSNEMVHRNLTVAVSNAYSFTIVLECRSKLEQFKSKAKVLKKNSKSTLWIWNVTCTGIRRSRGRLGTNSNEPIGTNSRSKFDEFEPQRPFDAGEVHPRPAIEWRARVFRSGTEDQSQCISLRLSVPTAFALGTSGWALVRRAARGTVARRVLGRGPAGFERGKAVSLQ